MSYRGWRKAIAQLATMLVLTTVLVEAPRTAMPALEVATTTATEACVRPDLSPSTPPMTGQSAARRPVVFVHGWTGKPLVDLANAVFNKLPTGISVFTFDYSKWAAYWASDDHIAPCLARYLREVSDAYKAVGGDGRIIYVAHSMGGLAIRYAMDPTKVNDAITSQQVPWIVTLDTPALGSPWGGLGVAQAKELFDGIFGSAVPNPFGVDGGRCLALHDSNTQLASSCDGLPPWLPGGTTLYQIGGSVTVNRSFLGVHLYNIPLASDGIVDYGSETGYLTSGPGGHAPVVTSPTTGTTVHSQEVDCTISSGELGNAITSLAGVLASADVPVELLSDWSALNTLAVNGHSPLTLGLDAAALFVADCSHIHVTDDPDAITQVVTDISTITHANPARVTPTKPLWTELLDWQNLQTDVITPYVLSGWAGDNSRNCNGRAYGQVATYLASHYCVGIVRALASTVIGGRPVGIATALVSFGNPPGWNGQPDPDIPGYEYAGGFGKLVSEDGTGNITDLLKVGDRFPNSGSAVPSPDAFSVSCQDNGCQVVDMWYLDGPTPENAPALEQVEQQMWGHLYYPR